MPLSATLAMCMAKLFNLTSTGSLDKQKKLRWIALQYLRYLTVVDARTSSIFPVMIIL